MPRRFVQPLAKSVFPAVFGLFAAAGAVPSARGFDIVFNFDYDTSGFFGAAGSQQRLALEAAASFFEGIIGDDLDAITPGGGNSWTGVIFRPDDVGTNAFLANLTIPADTIFIYAGADNLGPSGSLGIGGPAGFSGSGTPGFIDTLITRGETGTITPSTSGDDTDFAPWGGSIAFNEHGSINWNFDHTTAPTGAQYDFYSVALHEIGHVLGLSLSDSFDRLQVGSSFTGANSVGVYGGNVPLVSSGDWHWASGVTSDVYGTAISQEAAMTPSLANGERREFTELDVAGLADVGWEIVPEPNAAFLLTIGCVFLLLRRGPRRGA